MYDPDDSEQEKKDDGMKLAANANKLFLLKAREYAFAIACRHPDSEVDVETVREEFMRISGIRITGCWLGSLFKDGRFEFTGKWKQETHQGSHARVTRIWRLKPEFLPKVDAKELF